MSVPEPPPDTAPLQDPTPPKPIPAHAYAWTLRNWVQLGVLVLCLGIGVQFHLFVEQAAGTGPITVPRPAGVEGFLPIGGLMGWRLFVQTGMWDPFHPAAMVILGFAGLISLGLRKSFCGWFCPVGTISEWLWKLGQKVLGRNFILPQWLDLPLRLLKYALLGFFVYTIFTMSIMAIFSFFQAPYYRLADVRLLYFFTRMAQLTFWVLLGLVVFSFFIRNFWCRYLCPYGALMGLIALISPARIFRDETTCISCGLCTRVCPYHLPVEHKASVMSAECSGCLDCARVCPAPPTLQFKTGGRGGLALSRKAVAGLVLGVFVSLVYLATLNGHWQSLISPAEFRMRLKMLNAQTTQSGPTHPRPFPRPNMRRMPPTQR